MCFLQHHFIDNRTCAAINQVQHFSFINCDFTRSGQSITPSEIDFEDGWEACQDVFILNCKEKEKLSANKKIYLFKWFIKFLEIYGLETFGESASINWGLVHDEIIGHDIWSMDMELDNLLYNDSESLDSEEFRDKVFSYIEDRVIKGYPIFRLFYLPEKLKKYYEDENKQEIYEP